MSDARKGTLIVVSLLVIVLQLEVAWLIHGQSRINSLLSDDGFTFSRYVALRDWADVKGLSLAFSEESGVSFTSRPDGAVQGRLGGQVGSVRIDVSSLGEPTIVLRSVSGAVTIACGPDGPTVCGRRAGGELAWELK